MKIAVNAQTLIKDKMEGLGWFAYETLKRIVIDHPEHEFTFIFGKGVEKDFIFADNVNAVNIGPPFFRPLAWWLKFEFLLPRFVKKGNFDLFFSTDGWSSRKIKIPSIIVIHDINFVHFPQFLNKSFSFYYRKYFKQWVNSASEIITVSEYSKQDIIDTYKAEEHKIHVAYNGSNQIFTPVSSEQQEQVKQKYTNGKDFFTFIGAIHPRKNMINLLKAFDLYKKNNPSDVKLLVVGEHFLVDKKFKQVFNALSYKNDIIFAGRVFLNDLRLILGSAIALTYVSLFEGFGIPIVEAMSCDTPVITSNTTSMPEIAGDAALIVDPYSVEDIAKAMNEVASKRELREQLIKKGQERKKIFSWDKSAQLQWQVISKYVS